MENTGFIDDYIYGENTCVVCGRYVPEGTLVCSVCNEISSRVKEVKECEPFKSEDVPLPTDLDIPMKFKEPCYLCDNARLNNELEDDNDFTSSCIGSFSHDCRIMLSSGSGKPLRIEIAKWSDKTQQWVDIGIYYPKYCPECGREIGEYKNDSVVK